MERGCKGTKLGMAVFRQFALSGFKCFLYYLYTFYKQLSIETLIEDIQLGSYVEKSCRLYWASWTTTIFALWT